MLLARSADDARDAESCRHRPLDVARGLEARFFELRAAMSPARLRRCNGKDNESRELLGGR